MLTEKLKFDYVIRFRGNITVAAAGEVRGYDRFLESNTAKRRTHSLFRQGCMPYDLMPTMPEPRLLPLVRKFADMLADLPVFAETFGAV